MRLTPTNASWADPIEAQFGQLRMFTMANSDYPNHTTAAKNRLASASASRWDRK